LVARAELERRLRRLVTARLDAEDVLARLHGHELAGLHLDVRAVDEEAHGRDGAPVRPARRDARAGKERVDLSEPPRAVAGKGRGAGLLADRELRLRFGELAVAPERLARDVRRLAARL